jgi:hypothetical protein
MMSTASRNIIYGLALICIITIIAIPDVVVGLLFELIHFIFEMLYEVADVTFEWVETFLDKIVEHLFHTELHETQIIVFYVLMAIIAYPLYYLCRKLTRLYFRLKETLLAAWTRNKARATLNWQSLSLNDKIKWVVITAAAIYLASFLFM